MNRTSPAELIYVGDPMCSWCYAFSPELSKVLEDTGLSLRVVMGGLFVDDRTLPLDSRLRAYLHETWGRVSELSGRPISFEKLSWQEWVYDTELACRAVVAARHHDEGTAWDVFDRLQTAFYGEDRDLTDKAVLTSLVDSDPEIDLEDPAVVAATRNDFAEAKELGAHGLPTLLLDTSRERITVAAGYTPANRVIRSVRVLSS